MNLNSIDSTKLVGYLDLTNLNVDATPDDIIQLCAKAKTPAGNVAAVCVYPEYVALAKQELADSPIYVATVVNFPTGTDSITQVLKDTQQALADGADEIDLVGNTLAAAESIKQCKQLCGDKPLKVILETGQHDDQRSVAELSTMAIHAGADFIKTSTGKIPEGASLAAATTMLTAIKETDRRVGLKVSGGIRSTANAYDYYKLCVEMMGETWLSIHTFRIGASSLLDELLASAS